MSGSNLYTAGGYQESDPNAPYDVLVLKYDADASPRLQWAYSWGGGSTGENARSVAVSADDIYVTGSFGSAADPNSPDLLLLKLHDDGTSASFVASTTYVGANADIGCGIALADGKVYIAGYTTSDTGDTDALLLAYDTDLNLLWEHSWGGADDDVAYDVAVHDGTIYVTGKESGHAFVNAYTKTVVIPAVSQLGLLLMLLVLLSAGGAVILRRRAAA